MPHGTFSISVTCDRINIQQQMSTISDSVKEEITLEIHWKMLLRENILPKYDCESCDFEVEVECDSEEIEDYDDGEPA